MGNMDAETEMTAQPSIGIESLTHFEVQMLNSPISQDATEAEQVRKRNLRFIFQHTAFHSRADKNGDPRLCISRTGGQKSTQFPLTVYGKRLACIYVYNFIRSFRSARGEDQDALVCLSTLSAVAKLRTSLTH